MTACDDFDCRKYLIYRPSTKRNLIEDGMTELFQCYTNILMDEPIPVDHQSVENGG